MKQLDELIEYLEQDETIIAFKKIEAIIDQSDTYKTMYKDMIAKQKAMIQAREQNKALYPDKKAIYEEALLKLTSHPVIHQYLSLQAEVNDKIQSITGLIESVLNKPFTEK